MNTKHTGPLLLSAALLTGLHTGKRILIPASDTQEQNYVIHHQVKTRPTINAPLLWIEYVQDANGKTRTMQIKSQTNLATGAPVSTSDVIDEAPTNADQGNAEQDSDTQD